MTDKTTSPAAYLYSALGIIAVLLASLSGISAQSIPACGNSVCEAGETPQSCSADCPLTITSLTPSVIPNAGSFSVTIRGTGFNNQIGIGIEVSVPGSAPVLLVNFSTASVTYVDNNTLTLSFSLPPSGALPTTATFRVFTYSGSALLYSNPATVKVKVPSSIAQVAPLGLPASLGQSTLAALPVDLYGDLFEAGSAVLVDGVACSTPSCTINSLTSRTIQLLMTPAAAAAATTFQVIDTEGIQSNAFNAKEATARYPEIVLLSSPVVTPASRTIRLQGHNFFPSNSRLYLDGSLVSSSQYTIVASGSGPFIIDLDVSSLAPGVHSVSFDNPPRYPDLSVSGNQPYQRFASNIHHFLVVAQQLKPDIVLENQNIELTFDGQTGSLKKLRNEATGHEFTIKNHYPWRMLLRQLDLGGSQLGSANPVLYSQPYLNPFSANCIGSLSATKSQSVGAETLTLTWPGCRIDAFNTFDFIQDFTLRSGAFDVEMTYRIANAQANDYGIYNVRHYLTVDDTASPSWGLTANRIIEIYRNPGSSIASRGGRDTCQSSPASALATACGIYVNPTPEYMLNTDGDGFHLYNFMNVWAGYWDAQGNYLYAFPADDHSFPTGFSYQGEFGQFKAGLITWHPDSFSPLPAFQLPVPIRIGVGKGSTFTGKETWINIADLFKQNLQNNGQLLVPYAQKPVPTFLKNLDLHLLAYHGDDFIDPATKIPVTAPPIQQLVNTYDLAKQWYGAANMFAFVWGGDQDDRQGILMQPLPTTQRFLTDLNAKGIHPCYYTAAGGLGMWTVDPAWNAIRADTIEIDPAGTQWLTPVPTGGNLVAMHPKSDDPNSPSYLKYLLDGFRRMQVGSDPGTLAARCHYLDSIGGFVHPDGVWSRKFGGRGFDGTILSHPSFFKAYEQELVKIDPDAFVMHEASFDISAKDSGIYVQAGSFGGFLVEFWTGTDPSAVEQDVFWNQRVFGGYIDFIVSNAMVSPNERPPTFHIVPEYYSQLQQLLAQQTGSSPIPPAYIEATKPLNDTYLLPGAVGAIIGGGIPFVLEVGANAASGYLPLYDIQNPANQNPFQLNFKWQGALYEYAKLTKELVQARQLARPYFQGLWHPPLQTDAIQEDYWYFANADLAALLPVRAKDTIYKVTFPRVISAVRQSWSGSGWDDRYGLLFMNVHGRQPSQTVTFTVDFDRYGLQVGQPYDLLLTDATSSRYVATVADDFSTTHSFPAWTFVLFELQQMMDTDNDGVSDRTDRCLNTSATYSKAVNRNDGCPLPLSAEFSPALTTNFSAIPTLHAVSQLTLGVAGKGKIDFGSQAIGVLRLAQGIFGPLDIDTHVNISDNNITLDVAGIPELNKPATLTLYGLTLQNPVVLKDGALCTACQIISYASGDLVFSVPGFSTYSAAEGSCGDGVCSASESCSSCSQDCGTCPPQNLTCQSGQTRSCGSSVGSCRLGTQTCQSGQWGSCTGGIGPGTETCNGLDDDCDGQVDELTCLCLLGQSKPCGSNIGSCREGVRTCDAGGNWGSCTGDVQPAAEVCGNALDDDCDTETDETCGSADACANGVQDAGEEGVDCGGRCPNACTPPQPRGFPWDIILIVIGLAGIAGTSAYLLLKRKKK